MRFGNRIVRSKARKPPTVATDGYDVVDWWMYIKIHLHKILLHIFVLFSFVIFRSSSSSSIPFCLARAFPWEFLHLDSLSEGKETRTGLPRGRVYLDILLHYHISQYKCTIVLDFYGTICMAIKYAVVDLLDLRCGNPASFARGIGRYLQGEAFSERRRRP